MGRGQGAPERRPGRARAVRRAAAGRRRDSRVERRQGRADRPLLRPLRRAAACAARALGIRSVRGDDSRRVGLRARRRGRQGPALDAAARGRPARGRRGAADQHPPRLGRRGGGRRPVDRRVPAAGRARRRRVRDLRRRDGVARPAGDLGRDPRARGLQPACEDWPARPPLGHVRQCGAERDPRAAAGARRDPAARRPCPGAAPGRDRARHRRGARRLGEAADGRGRASRGRGGAVRRTCGGRVLSPHDRGDVRRGERDPRRQARAEEHDRDQRGAGELHRPPRAGPDADRGRPRGRAAAARGRAAKVRRSRSRSCPARHARASSPPVPL